MDCGQRFPHRLALGQSRQLREEIQQMSIIREGSNMFWHTVTAPKPHFSHSTNPVWGFPLYIGLRVNDVYSSTLYNITARTDWIRIKCIHFKCYLYLRTLFSTIAVACASADYRHGYNSFPIFKNDCGSSRNFFLFQVSRFRCPLTSNYNIRL